VVEGSLQRSDDQVQVSFQLVDAKSGTQLRVSRFDSNAVNLVETQDEIVARIARTLKLALLQIERGRIEQERPNHLDAHDLVMLGWARLNLDEPNRAETQRLFERALEIDPKSINAQLGLAKVLLQQLTYPRTAIFQQIETRAEQLLVEPLSKHGDLAQAHTTIGYLRRVQNRLNDSRIELEMAITLDHSNSWSYDELGLTLMYLGQPKVGIPYIEKAMRLNSSYPNIGYYYWGLGACNLLLGPAICF
jgi:adenylate cyclase